MKKNAFFSITLLELIVVFMLSSLLISLLSLQGYALWRSYRIQSELSLCREKIYAAKKSATLLNLDIMIAIGKDNQSVYLSLFKKDPFFYSPTLFQEKIRLPLFEKITVRKGAASFTLHGYHTALPLFEWELTSFRGEKYSLYSTPEEKLLFSK